MNPYQALDTSELDQDEIQKLKKRLEFIDVSNSRDANGIIPGTGMSTPSVLTQQPAKSQEWGQGGQEKRHRELIKPYNQKRFLDMRVGNEG